MFNFFFYFLSKFTFPFIQKIKKLAKIFKKLTKDGKLQNPIKKTIILERN